MANQHHTYSGLSTMQWTDSEWSLANAGRFLLVMWVQKCLELPESASFWEVNMPALSFLNIAEKWGTRALHPPPRYRAVSGPEAYFWLVGRLGNLKLCGRQLCVLSVWWNCGGHRSRWTREYELMTEAHAKLFCCPKLLQILSPYVTGGKETAGGWGVVSSSRV